MTFIRIVASRFLGKYLEYLWYSVSSVGDVFCIVARYQGIKVENMKLPLALNGLSSRVSKKDGRRLIML